MKVKPDLFPNFHNINTGNFMTNKVYRGKHYETEVKIFNR